MNMVLVEWVDTRCFSGWRHLDNLEEVTSAPSISVGFLILPSGENKGEDVILATTNGGSENLIADLVAIPKGCVKRVVELKEV